MSATLDAIIRLTNAKRSGENWIGKCVAHDDGRASLSFRESGDKMLFRCFTGCSFIQIVDALKSRGVEMARTEDPGWETVYPIRDTAGKTVAQHVRIDQNGGKTYRWRGPNGEHVKLSDLNLRVVDMPLYGAELLATTPGEVVLTEGERAAEAVRRRHKRLGLATVTGASTAPSREVLEVLKGRKVWLWPDNDEPGRQHMAKVAATLKAIGIEYGVIEWTGAPPAGDAADYMGDIAELLPQPKRVRALWEGTQSVLAELDRYSAGDFSDCTTTGLGKLDEKFYGGMRPGRVYLFGGATGTGKTVFAQHAAYAAAKQERGAVLFVSPEMSLESLNKREIIRRSGVPMWKRGPHIWNKQERQEAQDAHGLAASHMLHEKLPVLVLEELEVTMPVIEARAREVGKLALVVIDYAQYVAGESSRNTPRYLQVGEVAERSVELAIRLNVPVLVASQVNVAKDGNSRTYTFRESQILEHKAHAVLIFDVNWGKDENGNRKVDRADLICTKNRDGATFTLPVNYKPEVFQISDETAQVTYQREQYPLTPSAMPR